MKKYTYITKTFTDSAGVRHYIRGKTLEEAIVKREDLKRKLSADQKVGSSNLLPHAREETPENPVFTRVAGFFLLSFQNIGIPQNRQIWTSTDNTVLQIL